MRLKLSDNDGGRSASINPDQVRQWVEKANRIYTPTGIQFRFNPDVNGPDLVYPLKYGLEQSFEFRLRIGARKSVRGPINGAPTRGRSLPTHDRTPGSDHERLAVVGELCGALGQYQFD
jgi:hypothetical protein